MKYFKKKAGGSGDDLAVNRISTKTNVILNVVFLFWALICVLPLILVVIVSFSSEQSIFQNGYTFFPSEWSLDAYNFFFKLGDQLVRSYGITIFVTVVGTLFSLAITAMFAYVLSRNDYAYNRVFTFLMLFTMLFNGGIVATYMVNTQLLKLGDSVGALIFPMSLNAFYVIVLRTFYKGIPMEIIEAARIDGAGEFRTFFSIVLPILQPSLISTGILQAMWIWNDYLLPYLVLDLKRFKTIPIAVQYLRGGYGSVDMGAMMGMLVLAIAPILVMYFLCQKYIVSGVMAGAVKG